MLESTLTGQLPPPHRTKIVRHGNVWVKVEGDQLTGSVKYRMVYAKLKKAIRDGLVHDDTVLTEVTAGSTGVALAYAGQKLGLQVELHAYENTPKRKQEIIRRNGANLILHPLSTAMDRLLSIIAMKVERGRYWHLGQYHRVSTIEAYRDLGREIVSQMREEEIEATHFFAPVGTGGLLQGVGTWLREEFPSIRIVAVEPEKDACIDGMRNTELMYMGDQDPYDKSFKDDRLEAATPREPAVVGHARLGESGSAVFNTASRTRHRSFMVAPDGAA